MTHRRNTTKTALRRCECRLRVSVCLRFLDWCRALRGDTNVNALFVQERVPMFSIRTSPQEGTRRIVYLDEMNDYVYLQRKLRGVQLVLGRRKQQH